jgi:hypothetical protein
MRARYTFVCFVMPTFYAALNSCRINVMSALGQKKTFAAQKSHVRFTPESGHVWCDIPGSTSPRDR